MPNLRNGSKGAFEPGLSRLRVRHSTTELLLSTCCQPRIVVRRAEKYSRRNTVRIRGLKEVANEETDGLVKDLAA